MQVDSIPLNQNGKVNRRVLPKPELHTTEKLLNGTLETIEDDILRVHERPAIDLIEDILQVTNKAASPEIPLRSLDEEDFAAFKSNFVRPFKLDAEPLYRLEIVKTPARVSLFVDFHHLIFDGASMNLFLANLKTLLAGGTLEREGAIYFDFVREERVRLDENKKFSADLLKDFETASEITSDVRGKTRGEMKIFESAISVADFLRKTADSFATSIDHENYPFAQIASDETFTYRRLDEAANRIANALIARGIKPQSRVALLLPRTSRAIIAIVSAKIWTLNSC